MTDTIPAPSTASPTATRRPRFLNGWRIAGWSAALALVLLPAIAMGFTDEVDWTAIDFVFAGVLTFSLGIGIEIAVRVGRSGVHSLGLGIAAVAGFLTLWANAAVGFIGAEGEPVNIAISLMVVVAAILTLAARFRPNVLRYVFAAVALGQIAAGLYATSAMPGHAVEWGVLTVFAGIWSAAALCFHRAATRPA
ncbi:MAG: hypothetical protein VX454_03695 [Pseudomonadota bacterium]|jgi:hypothetical protein|nr:hypothetical protein [Pseudomonadota bacterium]